MEYGMKMLLRERIIDRGMHYLERGEIPPFALENMAARLRAGTKKDKAMEYGMKMLLRERIIDRGMHYLERGEIPPFALENIKGMHAAYVDLGDGDRSVNIIVERCKNLNIVNGG